eukprot:SAG31_NODE_1179_length_9530_cov_8.153748_6_plen_199_part_00
MLSFGAGSQEICPRATLIVRLRRCRMQQYIHIILECWHRSPIEKTISEVEACVAAALHDADSDTRAAARRCFAALARQWPGKAATMQRRFDSAVLKALQQDVRAARKEAERAVAVEGAREQSIDRRLIETQRAIRTLSSELESASITSSPTGSANITSPRQVGSPSASEADSDANSMTSTMSSRAARAVELAEVCSDC